MEGEVYPCHINLKSAVLCALLSSDISLLDSFFCDFPEESIYVNDSKTMKKLKDRELDHLFSKMADRPLQIDNPFAGGNLTQ